MIFPVEIQLRRSWILSGDFSFNIGENRPKIHGIGRSRTGSTSEFRLISLWMPAVDAMISPSGLSKANLGVREKRLSQSFHRFLTRKCRAPRSPSAGLVPKWSVQGRRLSPKRMAGPTATAYRHAEAFVRQLIDDVKADFPMETLACFMCGFLPLVLIGVKVKRRPNLFSSQIANSGNILKPHPVP